MTTPANIKAIAHLLAGHEPGWQTRFAKLVGISRGYAHNLLVGERPLNQQVAVKILQAVDLQVDEFEQRAAALRGARALLLPDLNGPITLPPSEPYTRAQYEADADEAEAIINELAGGTGGREE